MRLDSLTHLAKTALALMETGKVIVFGSASLLPSFPELGDDHGGPLERTHDADFIVEPWAEDIGVLLDNVLGNEEPFHAHFGYYADIIRPIVTEQFPKGWEERLIPLQGVERAWCLEPHDMAAAKCQAGRPKDIELLAYLFSSDRLDPAVVKTRLMEVAMREALIVQSHRTLREALARANGPEV
ncbi:DUF6036 family nucleotidyltransferase [Luteolibacter sp. LG18]|uniref:DUF6036 family nucleotidyltransferase n=1 Tax=Luteolibacter sp. LG18 TaxID=2819286 RepID=UPI002B2A9A42|nr:hypothetical protein llg_29760 [Luteolibacter sp. LG18]